MIRTSHPTRNAAADEPGSPVLAAYALEVRYGGIRAVRGVSFHVGRGERIALVGANGAGKSSTLRAVAGLIPLAGGRLRLAGEDVTELPAEARVARGIALVPEGRAVVPGLTVQETLRLGAYTHRDRATVAEGLEDVYNLFPRLAERRAQDASTLSGGEQQMLAMGRALMARPRVLLLDEPSLGLAPKVARVIFDAVVTVAEAGVAVILVEQNTRLALATCTRGYVLRHGAVVLEGEAGRLADDPEVKEAYLGGPS